MNTCTWGSIARFSQSARRCFQRDSRASARNSDTILHTSNCLSVCAACQLASFFITPSSKTIPVPLLWDKFDTFGTTKRIRKQMVEPLKFFSVQRTDKLSPTAVQGTCNVSSQMILVQWIVYIYYSWCDCVLFGSLSQCHPDLLSRIPVLTVLYARTHWKCMCSLCRPQ